MTVGAAQVLETVRRGLAPAEDANPFLPLVESGTASRSLIGEFAAQQRLIIASDRRSFLYLAARTADTPAGAYFAGLAAGESEALALLGGLAAACGLPDDRALPAREPLAGCQAYPAYLAWLALNGEPASVVLALAANFAAWGGYCARMARALRERYGFDDEACAFLDFFAAPAPGAEAQALAAVGAGAGAGAEAMSHGKLLQAYELMFWRTLAERERTGGSGRRGAGAPTA